MNTLKNAIVAAVFVVGLNLLVAGADFIGEKYSFIIGPISILGAFVALAVWAFKKGN